MAEPRRILIVLLGAIGDVVRAMPTAMRVRRAFPHAHIAWAVEPASAALLEDHPAIDERIIFRRDRGAVAFLGFLREVRRKRFDLVLDLQRHLKSGVVSRASGARRRLGFHRRNTKEGNWLFSTETIPVQEHWSLKVRQYLAFAEHLGLSGDAVEFGLLPRPEELERAAGLLEGVRRPFVAAFVGSTWESRFWWPESTAEVLREARDRWGLGAVLLGTETEAEFARAVLASSPPGTRSLAGTTSLRDVVAILSLAAVAFGPDSGPMHVAAAVGTPVVSLWGATSPARSAPWGFGSLAIVGDVDCHPCYLRRCPIGRLCMKQIRPATVVDGVRRALQGRAA